MSVRLAAVPDDAAFKTGELCNQASKIPDAGLHSGADVHRFRTVIPFGRKKNRLCRVVSAGRADISSGDESAEQAANVLVMAEDLTVCARLWRADALD